MTACACIGPFGDCPCIRLGKGVQPKIAEVYLAPDAWDKYLTLEEKQTINEMKMAAALRSVFDTQKESS